MAGGRKIGAMDPLLLHLAQLAGVRPPHIYHMLCFMREAKGRFIPSAYAAFTGLEPRHIARMLEIVESEGLGFNVREKSEALKASRLPEDFAFPPEWLLWGQTQRAWTRDVVETEAASFIAYWASKAGKDATKVSWRLTWENWCRRSRTPNGDYAPGTARSPDQYRQFCKEQLERETGRGDRMKILHWRRELEKL